MPNRLRLLRTAVLIPLLLGFSPASNAATDGLKEQRVNFMRARKAVRHGDLRSYQRYLENLADYPLRDYLVYEYLRPRLARVPEREIRAFLAANEDSPLNLRLRNAWLHSLARRGRWKTYLDVYRKSDSTTLRCHYLHAQLKTVGIQSVRNQIRETWLIGRSQPRACDPVFNAWIAVGGINTDLVWERIRLAMGNRRLSLARYLARFLGTADRKWVDRWQRMHRYPARELRSPVYRKDTQLVRTIIRHGVERLARIDAQAADRRWRELRPRYRFTKYARGETDRRIAMQAAFQRRPQAHALLSAVDPAHRDSTVREWAVRSALIERDWGQVITALDVLSPEQQSTTRWRYWRARALEQAGRRAMARTLFSEIAADHEYHSFLAADRLGVPYVFNEQSVSFKSGELDTIIRLPGILRARELFHLGLIVDARREWIHAIQRLPERSLQLAAVLAQRWGWHDRAILTVAKGNHFDDLVLRFPIVFRRQVERNAKRYRIEPAWVFGVLRQESAFMTDARSTAGALGLMQLLPRTARSTARRSNTPLRRTRDLLNADKNIRLGTAHLKRVLDTHDGDHVLATAAYNAGVQRVRRWMPTGSPLAADIWVESVPFTETRNYVKRVISYTVIFEKRLGQPITPLIRRMRDIGPAS